MGRDNQINISITSGSIVRGILFLLLLFFLYQLLDLVLVILTAIVIASAIEPGTRWFERYKVPRVVGVLVIYLFIAAIFLAVLYWFVPPLVSDITSIVSQAPEYLASLEIGGLLGDSVVGSEGAIENLSKTFTVPESFGQLQQIVKGTSAGAFGFVSGVFGGLLNFVLIVSISFYLAVQKDGIASFLRIVTPLKHESYVIDLWKRSQAKIGRWLQGQLILMLIVGILTYLGLTILGVKNAFLLAILAGLFELIPLFGPVLSAIPATAIALIDGGLTLGLMTLGLFVIVQQFENHLLHPVVVKKVVGVPALVVIISLVIGGTLAGFLGLILSVPIAAALMELANDVEVRKKKQSEDEHRQPSLLK